MHELRVRGDGDELGAHLREPFLLLCQSSELCRSDEGEVSRIVEEDRPPAGPHLVAESRGAELLGRRIVVLDLEVRHGLSDADGRVLGHHGSPRRGTVGRRSWHLPPPAKRARTARRRALDDDQSAAGSAHGKTMWTGFEMWNWPFGEFALRTIAWIQRSTPERPAGPSGTPKLHRPQESV